MQFGAPVWLTKAEIKEMEKSMNYGKSFPKAYREFLFLGGKSSALQLEDYGKNIPKVTEGFRQGLKKRKIVLVRPFAMIDVFEGSCGTFIYLDEGDNPKPHLCSIDEAYDSDEDEIIWNSPYKTFGDFIDKLIYLAERNLSV